MRCFQFRDDRQAAFLGQLTLHSTSTPHPVHPLPLSVCRFGTLLPIPDTTRAGARPQRIDIEDLADEAELSRACGPVPESRTRSAVAWPYRTRRAIVRGDVRGFIRAW